MPTYLGALGPALRLLRSRRQLKQTQVAEKSGLTKAMLSSYETGKATPSLASLDAFLDALETDFSELQDALRAASGIAGSGGAPSGPAALREGVAWSELREVLREFQAPLERLTAVIERLCGPDEAVVDGEGGIRPAEQHQG
jgi:transcriptional regulator with XRE-family HTH domain